MSNDFLMGAAAVAVGFLLAGRSDGGDSVGMFSQTVPYSSLGWPYGWPYYWNGISWPWNNWWGWGSPNLFISSGGPSFRSFRPGMVRTTGQRFIGGGGGPRGGGGGGAHGGRGGRGH